MSEQPTREELIEFLRTMQSNMGPYRESGPVRARALEDIEVWGKYDAAADLLEQDGEKLAKLPTTADGVPVVPGMTVWTWYRGHMIDGNNRANGEQNLRLVEAEVESIGDDPNGGRFNVLLAVNNYLGGAPIHPIYALRENAEQEAR